MPNAAYAGRDTFVSIQGPPGAFTHRRLEGLLERYRRGPLRCAPDRVLTWLTALRMTFCAPHRLPPRRAHSLTRLLQPQNTCLLLGGSPERELLPAPTSHAHRTTLLLPTTSTPLTVKMRQPSHALPQTATVLRPLLTHLKMRPSLWWGTAINPVRSPQLRGAFLKQYVPRFHSLQGLPFRSRLLEEHLQMERQERLQILQRPTPQPLPFVFHCTARMFHATHTRNATLFCMAATPGCFLEGKRAGQGTALSTPEPVSSCRATIRVVQQPMSSSCTSCTT